MFALLAQTGDSLPVFDQVITLPPTWALILAGLSPGLVSMLAKYRGDDHYWHKVLAAGLTILIGVIAMLTDDVPNDTVSSVISTIVQLGATQFIAFLFVFSPLKTNQKLLPDKGVGPPAPTPTVDPAVVGTKENDGPPAGQH